MHAEISLGRTSALPDRLASKMIFGHAEADLRDSTNAITPVDRAIHRRDGEATYVLGANFYGWKESANGFAFGTPTPVTLSQPGCVCNAVGDVHCVTGPSATVVQSVLKEIARGVSSRAA